MRAKPAGKEMSCRIPGMSLPVNVEISPCFVKK